MDLSSYLKKYLKKDAFESILAALVFLIIGVFIVVHPEGTLLTFSYVIGGIFVLAGIVKVISYFAMKGNEDLFNYDLVFGLIAIIVGVIFITQSALLNTVFRIVVAIWLIYSGLIKATTSLKLKKFDVKAWWAVLIIAVLMIIAGIYVISYAGILVATLGVFMIVYAIFDLINAIIFIIDVNKYIE